MDSCFGVGTGGFLLCWNTILLMKYVLGYILEFCEFRRQLCQYVVDCFGPRECYNIGQVETNSSDKNAILRVAE